MPKRKTKDLIVVDEYSYGMICKRLGDKVGTEVFLRLQTNKDINYKKIGGEKDGRQSNDNL